MRRRERVRPRLLVAAGDDERRIGARRDVVELAGRVPRVHRDDHGPCLVGGDVGDREPVRELGRQQQHHAVAGGDTIVDERAGERVRPRVPRRERHRVTVDDVDRDPVREPFRDRL